MLPVPTCPGNEEPMGSTKVETIPPTLTPLSVVLVAPEVVTNPN